MFLLILIKKYYSYFIFCLILLAIIPFYKDSQIEEVESSDSKRIEISDSHVKGFSNGKLSWQIESDYVWTGKSSYLFQAKNVFNGELYNSKDELVVKNLQTQQVKVNSNSKTVTAQKDVSCLFIRRPKVSKRNSFGILESQRGLKKWK